VEWIGGINSKCDAVPTCLYHVGRPCLGLEMEVKVSADSDR